MPRSRLYKIFRAVTPALIVLVVFFISKNVLAQGPQLGVNALKVGGLQLGGGDIRVIIGRIVQVFLSLIGMIFVILIIYAGWLWMSAAGAPDQITKAKKTLVNSIIGLVIILSSFGIAQFIISGLGKAQFGAIGGPGVVGGVPPGLIGSLGAGIVGNHIPARGQVVPRNSKVAIMFKEPIDATSIISDTNNDGIYGDMVDEVNKASVKLVKTNILQTNNNFKNLQDSDLVTLMGAFTPDGLNFVFQPQILLGNSNETVSYTILLTTNIKKADGSNAFSGSFAEGYMWQFSVEPTVDNTPPIITNVIPKQGVNPRNTVVQINFSESLDPTSASGNYTSSGGFQNITLVSGANILTGSYKISNSFKTIEFVTDSLCGVNSCGGDVYCLPGGATGANAINVLVHAATVGTTPPASAGFPYDGIVDLAGNSLDGNMDGVAEGPQFQSSKIAYQWVGGDQNTQGDDVAWSFETSNDIDLISPIIESIMPGIDANNVPLNLPIEIRFSKLMSSYTLDNNLFIKHNVTDPNYALWWRVETESLDANNQLVTPSADPVKTKARIVHGDFYPDLGTPPAPQFYPSVDSKVQDLRQNCFVPAAGPACAGINPGEFCCNGVITTSRTVCSYLP